METWFEEHPDHAAPPNPAVDAGPPHIASLEEIMDDPRFPHCESSAAPVSCANTPAGWLRAQLPGVVLAAVLPLGLSLIGCWLFCVGLVAVVRRRRPNLA